MIRPLLVAAFALTVAACQSTNPNDYAVDQNCVQRTVGSKILAKVTGVGLGLAGVPGGGLAGRGVAFATDPRCQAFVLAPEAKTRVGREPPAVANPFQNRVESVPSSTSVRP